MFSIPLQVTPELNADIGVKKGEKVDYAILLNGKPIILIECKHHSADLSKVHASQLYRYFSVTDARFSLLTNGLIYWFYTDLDAANKMDSKPFFEFNLLDIKEAAVEELKKFSKTAFDLDSILTTASELKYTREIRRIITEQMHEPSDEFVKFFIAQVYSGRMTQPVREHFAYLLRQAFKQVVNEQINDRLKTALASETVSTVPADTTSNAATEKPSIEAPIDAVTTTPEEIEAYQVVRAILREIVEVKRIVMRDVHSYCGILLDDNNRKTICRFHFNRTQKYIGFFTGQIGNQKDVKEERVPISGIDDIYKFADRLKATVSLYESAAGKKSKATE